MSCYSTVVLPRLLDWVMAREVLATHRRSQLAQVHGKVLEIGFGTGVNLPYYPPAVRKITTIDQNPGMNPVAQKRIRASRIVVESHVRGAETLPLADHTFDTVVSTTTFCSIANVAQALQEIYRVLKPGGRLLFLEHGLSTDPKIQVWQHRLTPLSKLLGDGCHLNRNIQQLVQEHPFTISTLRTFYLEKTPKITGYMYQGVALKP